MATALRLPYIEEIVAATRYLPNRLADMTIEIRKQGEESQRENQRRFEQIERRIEQNERQIQQNSAHLDCCC